MVLAIFTTQKPNVMKQVAFICLLTISSVCVHAQIDNNSLLSDPNNNNTIFALPENPRPDEAGLPIYNKPSEGLVKPNDNFSFELKDEFSNPGTRYDEKLDKTYTEKGERGSSGSKTDQYLGDFKTKSGFVKIACRDHEYPDGDRVKVVVNDIVVKENILLESAFKGFSMDLEKGFNKIDFIALNQGESGPNTAELRIYDDTGKAVAANRWNLATGVKATLIIVKE